MNNWIKGMAVFGCFAIGLAIGLTGSITYVTEYAPVRQEIPMARSTTIEEARKVVSDIPLMKGRPPFCSVHYVIGLKCTKDENSKTACYVDEEWYWERIEEKLNDECGEI